MAKKNTNKIESYFERGWIKYFITFTAIMYPLGAVIWTTYLANINVFEFEILQLRFIFVGLMFSFITAILAGIPFGIYKLVKFIFIKIKRQEIGWEKLTKEEKSIIYKKNFKLRKKKILVAEVVAMVLGIPWLIFYSLFIFDNVPSAFGGGKPILIRLIGEPKVIQELNSIIAYETGIDVKTLPYEELEGVTPLAVSANVKMLDRNRTRYFLILTEDLYLSSTSNVAKKLLESGDFDGLSFNKNFKAKPIFFATSDIRGTTTTLYEPPEEIITENDFKYLAKAVSQKPEYVETVKDVVSNNLPRAEEIVAEIQKKAESNEKNLNNGQEKTVSDEDLNKIINEFVDFKFINFRSNLFAKINQQILDEKTKQTNGDGRLVLVKNIKKEFLDKFPKVWESINYETGYLAVGQHENNFLEKLRNAFRGAENIEEIANRINSLQVEIIDNFTPTKTLLLNLIDNSSPEKTTINHKFVSAALREQLNGKAKQERSFWDDNRYLFLGTGDPDYLKKTRKAIEISFNWEDFREKFAELDKNIDQFLAEEKAEIEEVKDETKEEITEEKTETEVEPETEDVIETPPEIEVVEIVPEIEIIEPTGEEIVGEDEIVEEDEIIETEEDSVPEGTEEVVEIEPTNEEVEIIETPTETENDNIDLTEETNI